MAGNHRQRQRHLRDEAGRSFRTLRFAHAWRLGQVAKWMRIMSLTKKKVFICEEPIFWGFKSAPAFFGTVKKSPRRSIRKNSPVALDSRHSRNQGRNWASSSVRRSIGQVVPSAKKPLIRRLPGSLFKGTEPYFQTSNFFGGGDEMLVSGKGSSVDQS